MKKHDGFTILELLVTIGIVAVIISVVRPTYEDWWASQSLMNSFNELGDELSTIRSEALSRNNTTRVNLEEAGGIYTLTAYVSPAPVSDCNPMGTWIQLYTKQIELHSGFTITGSGLGDICLYRDGSTSGAQYDINGGSTGSASIIVTMATGYLDATITN